MQPEFWNLSCFMARQKNDTGSIGPSNRNTRVHKFTQLYIIISYRQEKKNEEKQSDNHI